MVKFICDCLNISVDLLTKTKRISDCTVINPLDIWTYNTLAPIQLIHGELGLGGTSIVRYFILIYKY